MCIGGKIQRPKLTVYVLHSYMIFWDGKIVSKDALDGMRMEAQSCMDHSILAIFEDSTVAAEDSIEMEGGTDSSLLTALTEILDNVEDDERALSPFKILPHHELLTDQEHRNSSPLRTLFNLAGSPPVRDPLCSSSKSFLSSVKRKSNASRPRRHRLRPQNIVLTHGSHGTGEDRSKGKGCRQPHGVLHPHQKSLTDSLEVEPQKPEAEIQVFTSMSLVNLVKLMHPYCLRLCVEEEGKGWVNTPRHNSSLWDKLSTDHTLSSQGEILKYEKPSGDSDEEINVDMSDDEAPLKETKTGEEGVKRTVAVPKSVLVNRDTSITLPSREKKKVSFGAVQVTSFEAPAEDMSNPNELTRDIKEQPSEITALGPLGSARPLETLTYKAPETLSAAPAETRKDKTEVTEALLTLPSQAKPKPLSLQQYRQLRQKRLPLVERQRNYSTKWPSLPEPPKELTPIPCLQGLRPNKWGPEAKHLHTSATEICNDRSNRVKNSDYKTSSCHASLHSKDNSVEAEPSNHLHHTGRKCPRTESKIPSPVSPVSSLSATACVDVFQSRIIPEKTSLLLSSDPPNPVLLTLPVIQSSRDSTSKPASPTTTQPSLEPQRKSWFLDRKSNLKSTSLLREIQKTFSNQAPKRGLSSLEPKSKESLLNQDPNTQGAYIPKENNNKMLEHPLNQSPVSVGSPAKCPTPTINKPISQCTKPQSQQCSRIQTEDKILFPKYIPSSNPDTTKQEKCPSGPNQPPTPINTAIPIQQISTSIWCLPSEKPSSPVHLSCTAKTQTDDSEAPDLTSLLEQFEETQEVHGLLCAGFLNNEKRLCTSPPGLASIPKLASPPQSVNLQLLSVTGLEETQTVEPEIPHGQVGIPSVVPAEIPAQELCSTSEMLGTAKPLGIVQPLQTVESAQIPESLSIDVILGTPDHTTVKHPWQLSHSPAQRKQLAKPKSPTFKAIQLIDPRPLLSKKTHTSPPKSPATHTSAQRCLPVSVFLDHDYCVSKDQLVINAMLCSKNQASSTKGTLSLTNEMHANAIDPHATTACQKYTTSCETHATVEPVNHSECVLQHPSEDQWAGSETFSESTVAMQESGLYSDISEDRKKPHRPVFPRSPPNRGRERKATKKYRRRSPPSDSSLSSPSSSSSSCSSSRSRSRSPQRKRIRPKRSESSSCSSSCSRSRSITHSPPRRYRLSYSTSQSSRSRSRSRSWSQSQSRSPSRSRSPSPRNHRKHWRDVCSPMYCRKSNTESRRCKRLHEKRIEKLKAIEERRVVYVGRIQRHMTHKELKERFSLFGEVECVSLHFRDRGDNYGFVTFYNMADAFAAVENGSKLRMPDELPLDICFGGRRQFCKSDYADLDSSRDADPTPANNRFQQLDFDSLLKQAQKCLKR
ncbi:peroxisome proliferator-activated receptor gamma coactivator-related protein 1-like isoform X2 [Lampris incognitus]|uniref:peroxisome proliferator-activated receptor gamma coactivator-related protein 1-like isoform X2 n=1 Tax=Lampris incognitus TaxID=2546036 RepID=UPI0024B572EA|nr:peroxisome proliferator-activated receptor gamma coactivator-related protein 1-like isoform X2 [Lampris incognitus]